MADVEPLLTSLVDPPLAPRPPLAEIRERAAGHRRRRRVGGLALGFPAVAVAVGLAVLLPGSDVAVRTVGPVSGGSPAPTSAPDVQASLPSVQSGPGMTQPPGPIVIGTVAVGAREFRLTAERRDGTLCVGLMEGDHGRSRCQGFESLSPLSAGVIGTDGVQLAYGTAPQDAAAVRVESPDGSSITTPALRGPADLGVTFFAVPIPSPRYTAVVALDQSGAELFRDTDAPATGPAG